MKLILLFNIESRYYHVIKYVEVAHISRGTMLSEVISQRIKRINEDFFV